MNDSWQQTILTASKPVRYAAAAALTILALFLAVKTVDAMGNLGHSTVYPSTTITVDGTGTATATSSLAKVSFTVSETAATVGDAQTAATTKTNTALDAVEKLGVDEKDLKTTSYNVSPQYTYPSCTTGYCPNTPPKITGYTVSQTVEVKVRDVTKAGDVLQALGTAEVENISGPDFTTEDTDAVKASARAEAVANAKDKAQALAKELGVHLGKVVSFYENTPGPIYYGMGGDAAMGVKAESAPAPTLPTGENETTVSVNITYEIN